MKKIKGTDRQPIDFEPTLGWVKMMPAILSYNSKTALFIDQKGKTYLKEEVEWIDDSNDEVVFTKEQLIECWEKAKTITISNIGWDREAQSIDPDYSYIDKEKKEYFKKKYKIDL